MYLQGAGATEVTSAIGSSVEGAAFVSLTTSGIRLECGRRSHADRVAGLPWEMLGVDEQ